MNIKPPKSFGGLVRWAKAITPLVNALDNTQIMRSGSVDSITRSDTSRLINLQDMITKAEVSALGGGGGAGDRALQLVKVADDDLCVTKGTIGSIIPTIDSVELVVDYTENSLPLPTSGIREYWLKITLDSSVNITSVSIENTEPTADTTTQAKLLLGTVEVDSSVIQSFVSNLTGSQSMASCGPNHFFGVV